MIDDFRAQIGQDIGLSRWFHIDQARIDRFADVTEDHQFIHVDPAAAAHSPFGGTIAHGFLTLSLLSAMAEDALPGPEGRSAVVNAGMDRLRFVSPVPVGSNLRARFTLADATQIQQGETALTYDVTIERQGHDRPALVARWLTRHYFPKEEQTNA